MRNPQGSVLGPCIFNTYVNAITESSTLDISMYAYDTTLNFTLENFKNMTTVNVVAELLYTCTCMIC